MKFTSPRFHANVRVALEDVVLRDALDRGTVNFVEGRRKAFADTGDLEELRSQARAVKERALARLDEYVEHLERRITANGGAVHFAHRAEDVCRIVADLARRRGARLAVKGKSMTSEEVNLNEFLEGIGIEVVETDLGEFIIQLTGEPPSHIVAPAIHKTKEQVARVFEKKFGMPYTDDIETMAAVARRHLREKFFQADLGITGANFAVAETGTLVIVSNEGNVRYSSSLPKVHVAVMGVEKIIPTMADLGVFLRLLPRAAGSRKMTSYVSMLSGPRRSDEEDGPDELHLILLDGGRSGILRSEFREALNCIRCGACLNHCPVYQSVGGHAYGWVYPGPIGAVLTPLFRGLEHAKELPQASSLCEACKDVCPVKIDIPGLLIRLRSRLAQEKRFSWFERLSVKVWQAMMLRRGCYVATVRIAGWVQRLVYRNGRCAKLPFPMSRWTKTRDFPIAASKPFHQRWQEELRFKNQ